MIKLRILSAIITSLYLVCASLCYAEPNKIEPSFSMSSLSETLGDLANSTYIDQGEIYLKAKSLMGKTPLSLDEKWFLILALRPLVEKTMSSYFQEKVLPAYNRAVQIYTRPTKSGVTRSLNLSDYSSSPFQEMALHLLHVSLGLTKDLIKHESQAQLIENLHSCIAYRLAGDASLWNEFFQSNENKVQFHRWLERVNENTRDIKIVAFIDHLMTVIEPGSRRP